MAGSRPRLVTQTQAAVRRELAAAFLHASWERQAQEPPGRLQELLTGFVAAVARLMDTLVKGITSVFSLLALVTTAVIVSPIARDCPHWCAPGAARDFAPLASVPSAGVATAGKL